MDIDKPDEQVVLGLATKKQENVATPAGNTGNAVLAPCYFWAEPLRSATERSPQFYFNKGPS